MNFHSATGVSQLLPLEYCVTGAQGMWLNSRLHVGEHYYLALQFLNFLHQPCTNLPHFVFISIFLQAIQTEGHLACNTIDDNISSTNENEFQHLRISSRKRRRTVYYLLTEFQTCCLRLINVRCICNVDFMVSSFSMT